MSVTGLSRPGEALFVGGTKITDGIVNKGKMTTDYLSADVTASGVVTFKVGSFGPGTPGHKMLGYGATAVSFDLSGKTVNVAGVDGTKPLAEISLDIAASALKSTGDIAFTLGKASGPQTVKVSSDQALSAVDFLVVSDDAGTLKKIDSGYKEKSLTFTFGKVEANSVDFVVAFDETYSASHDVTVVASSDKGKTTFKVTVKDQTTPPSGGDVVSVDVLLNEKLKEGLTSVDVTDSLTPYSSKPTVDKDTSVLASSVLVDKNVSGVTGIAAAPLRVTIDVSKITDAAVSTDFSDWPKKAKEEKIKALDEKGYALLYQYVEGKVSKDVEVLIGGPKMSWTTAEKEGYVAFNSVTGALEVRYVVTNEDKKDVEHHKDTRFIYIADGDKNTRLYDPVWFAKTPADSGWSGDSGCDAGFGAFALLGLAGTAALLRRRD